MNRVLISILSGALMAGVAMAQANATPAQNSPASQPQTPATLPAPQAVPQAPQAGTSAQARPTRIAPGSVIPVLLAKTIDAKKAKTGDEVVARVTQDIKTTSGEVLVPKDTKVMGHVTEAQARNKEQKESAIAFDRAVTKDGSEMQMPMSIQAIIGPQNNGPQNNNAAGGTSDTGASSPASPTPSSGARPGMGGTGAAPAPSGSAGEMPSDAQKATSARPPITANTQGVVGISNLSLTTAAPNPAQGSVVTSDKNNVKLESGTMMLLRVNQ